jgi:hypothetical protein
MSTPDSPHRTTSRGRTPPRWARWTTPGTHDHTARKPTTRRVRGRPDPRRHRERGTVTAQTAVLTPALLGLILMIVQVAVWQHATHCARAAAEQALAATRVQHGSPRAGHAAAEALLHTVGQVVTDPAITIDRRPSSVTVTIDGYAEPVIPGLHLPVHARSVGVPEPPEPGETR